MVKRRRTPLSQDRCEEWLLDPLMQALDEAGYLTRREPLKYRIEPRQGTNAVRIAQKVMEWVAEDRASD